MPRAQDPEDVLVMRFLRTPEGIALNTAFNQIADPDLRQYIIELARDAAESSATPKQDQGNRGAVAAP